MLVLLPFSAAADETLIVKPARLYLRAAAGEEIRASLFVHGAEPAVSLREFDVDRDGKPTRAADASRSLLPWMTVKSLETASGRSQIDVHIRIPPEARGSYWAAVIIEPRENGGVHAARIRMAVPVVVAIANDELPSLKITSLTASAEAGTVLVTAEVENAGSVALIATITAAVELDEREAVREGTVLVLPGHARVVTYRVPFAANENSRSRVVTSLYVRHTASNGSMAIEQLSTGLQ